jgi:ureidoglycolate hydrolase
MSAVDIFTALTLVVCAGNIVAGTSSTVLVESGKVLPVATIEVKPEPLVEKEFRTFGQVLQVPAGQPPSIENASMRRWNGIVKARMHENVEFSLIDLKVRERLVAEMERNTRSPELMVALKGEFLLAVAPTSAKGGRIHPDASRIRVFELHEGEGVLLNKGCWHAVPFPRNSAGRILVAYRSGVTGKKDLPSRPFRGREVVKF